MCRAPGCKLPQPGEVAPGPICAIFMSIPGGYYSKPPGAVPNALILAVTLIAAAATSLPAPPLAQSQAPPKGMDPQLLARANAGDANSQYLVAFAYQNGVGVPKDLAQAAKWYRKAPEGGNRRSMEILGTMYERGLGGLLKDDVQAVVWFWSFAAYNPPGSAHTLVI